MHRAALALACATLMSLAPASGVAADNVYMISPSIDSTGRTTVSSALNSLIDRVPNGSRIVFRAGGTYRLDRALHISGRRNLTLDGNGARLELPRSYRGYDSAGIVVRRSRGTTIRGFTMVGNNHEAGTRAACCRRESQHGIIVQSSIDTVVKRVHIRRVWGDCLYVNAARVPGGAWSRGVLFQKSTCRLTGRHGVGIIRGRGIRIVDNVFDEIGFMVVDIEPGARDAGAKEVLVRGNDVGSYGRGDQDNAWLLAACGANGSVVRFVKIVNNTIEGNRIGWSGSITRPWRALNIRVCGEGRRVRTDFKVIRNRAKARVQGPSLYFSRVARVTVWGNQQPLSSGRLTSITRPR